jgi:hypothetical protein
VSVTHGDTQVLAGCAVGFESHPLKFHFHGNKVQRPESVWHKKGSTIGAALFKNAVGYVSVKQETNT